MKIGLSALLGVFVMGAGFAATSAGAATLPASLHGQSAVTRATFWVDDEKKEKVKKHKAHKKRHVANSAPAPKHPPKHAKKPKKE